MDINKANMDLFFTEVKTEWQEAFNIAVAEAMMGKVAMQVPSKTAITTHGWLKQIPAMRKWVGDRVVNNVESQPLAVSNVKYEGTTEITREEFEDDQYGLYINIFRNMASSAVLNKDRAVIDALLQGTVNTWADGVAVFSAAGRTYGANTIKNYVTTAYDAAGTALTTAIADIGGYLGHGGTPLFAKPKYILHGPALRTKVQQSLSTYAALLAANASTYVGGQIENPNANIVTPIETAWLTDGYVDLNGTTYSNAGKHWFILSEISGIKGLVYQSRLEPELQDQRAKLDSEYLFTTDKLQWGTRMRGAGFVSFPHLVYGGFATS